MLQVIMEHWHLEGEWFVHLYCRSNSNRTEPLDPGDTGNRCLYLHC